MTLAAEVLNELRALHWSSHGNGATVPELASALKMRGVDPGSRAHIVDVLLDDLADRCRPTDDRRNEGGFTPHWTVYVPTDPIEAG